MKTIAILTVALSLLLLPHLNAQADIDPFEPMTKEEVAEAKKRINQSKKQINENSEGLGDLMLSNAMDNQMKRMVEIVMDQQIQYLEKPDTLKRIATIAKQYHEELIEAGFSREEALEIVSRSSILPSLSQ